jgi:predicted ribosome quality control (RQC) complex YloA/Tae2 family protein
MTLRELQLLCAELNSLNGTILDRVLFDQNALQLSWSTQGGKPFWLSLSLKPGAPFIFLSAQRLHLIRNQNKPVSLFIHRHFVGKTLRRAQVLETFGRVLRLSFEDLDSPETEPEITLSLVPGALNVQASWRDKKISAFKPKELQVFSASASEAIEPPRTSQDFFELWQNKQRKKPDSGPKTLEREIEKKAKGLESMEKKLSALQSSPWLEVGEWLKTQVDLEGVPPHWKQYVDFQQSLVWNMENCFTQWKKSQRKMEGTQQRVQQLTQEIEALKSGEQKPKSKVTSNSNSSLLYQAQAKGRTRQLEDLTLYIGRSGTENLKLLRKAKPWYLWLHIRDYPGAFGVIQCPRGTKNIKELLLQQAALEVIKESLPRNSLGRYEVLYTECRYVRPIKGAKAGQVTYSHERVISVKVET